MAVSQMGRHETPSRIVVDFSRLAGTLS